MLRRNKIIATILAAAVVSSVVFTGCGKQQGPSIVTASTNVYSGVKKPKYVFLFIGDGMGMSQISSAEMFLGNQKNPKNPNIEKMSFTKFNSQGMSTTYAADTFITDSASAGTAIATGNKTNDGVINMDPTKTVKYTSMAEMAKQKGMKVGIVSSVSIDHATPAVFYAHNASRNNYYDIALELSKSNFDYFAGGGLKQPTGSKKDKPDAYKEIEKEGYKIVKDKDSFTKLDKSAKKVMALSPKLDADQALPYAINNDKDSISLADFTKKGIDLLDNEKGFFMMVEGGKIDWACHANDAATSIKDVVAFDDAVKQALDFYEKHKEETLILVTADHETGGLTLGFAGTGYNTYFNKVGKQNISYDEFTKKVSDYKKNGHTPENASIEEFLPLINLHFGLQAMDPNEYKELSKVAADSKNPNAKEATEKLAMALTPTETEELKAALVESMKDSDKRSKDEKTYLLYGGYDPFTMAITHIISKKAGMAFTSYAHTGIPVPVFAQGKGEELFTGYYDNTDIFKKLTSVMDIKSGK